MTAVSIGQHSAPSKVPRYSLSFIPGDNVADTNFPQSSANGGQGEQDGGKDDLPLHEGIDEALLLQIGCQYWLSSFTLEKYDQKYLGTVVPSVATS